MMNASIKLLKPSSTAASNDSALQKSKKSPTGQDAQSNVFAQMLSTANVSPIVHHVANAASHETGGSLQSTHKVFETNVGKVSVQTTVHAKLDQTANARLRPSMVASSISSSIKATGLERTPTLANLQRKGLPLANRSIGLQEQTNTQQPSRKAAGLASNLSGAEIPKSMTTVWSLRTSTLPVQGLSGRHNVSNSVQSTPNQKNHQPVLPVEKAIDDMHANLRANNIVALLETEAQPVVPSPSNSRMSGHQLRSDEVQPSVSQSALGVLPISPKPAGNESTKVDVTKFSPLVVTRHTSVDRQLEPKHGSSAAGTTGPFAQSYSMVQQPALGESRSNATAQTTVDLSKSNAYSEFSQLVQGQISQNVSTLHVHVKPEGMGDMVISVTKENASIHVHVDAAQAQTFEWIQHSQHAVVEALQSAGVDVASLQLTFGQSGSFEQPQSQHPNAEHNAGLKSNTNAGSTSNSGTGTQIEHRDPIPTHVTDWKSRAISILV